MALSSLTLRRCSHFSKTACRVFASGYISLSPSLSHECLLFSVTLTLSVALALSFQLPWSLTATSLGQAIRLRVHPLYLMIPGTVGCSYAFMLPVSTPPNSIAFASGHLLVKDMVSWAFPAVAWQEEGEGEWRARGASIAQLEKSLQAPNWKSLQSSLLSWVCPV